MIKNITYAQFDTVLRKLGFEKRELKSGHIAYAHRETETLLTMPPMEAEVRVQPGHLLTARKMIVDRGIAEEDTFFEMLCEAKREAENHTMEVASG